MDSKFEAMLNGGTDYLPQDAGEWRAEKIQDEDEVYNQAFLKNIADPNCHTCYGKGTFATPNGSEDFDWEVCHCTERDELETYKELPVGMY